MNVSAFVEDVILIPADPAKYAYKAKYAGSQNPFWCTRLTTAIIRRATPADRGEILGLVPRLVEFGPPRWRDPHQMIETDVKVISAALDSTGDDPLVLVAASAGDIAGFVHVHSALDYYTERKNGHVADIVVAPKYESQGIGTRLLAAAEGWARRLKFEFLTISVFEENQRAARTYTRYGFRTEVLRLLKPLTSDDPEPGDRG